MPIFLLSTKIYTSYVILYKGAVGNVPYPDYSRNFQNFVNNPPKVVAKFLKLDGTFVFVEFHPAVWKFGDNFEEVAGNHAAKRNKNT